MGESLEHKYLNEQFLQTIKDFSKLKLYGFKETERKKFDFSCLVKRDWNRPLVGQTVWKHVKGIDKDIRLLLTDKESEIKVYMARDTIKNRYSLEEIVNDFKKSGRYNDLFKLKIFWIPSDFEADNEKQKFLVKNSLKSSIVDDILFNVVFENLTKENIRFFLDVSGTIGLNLALLYEIATDDFINIQDMSNRLDVSSGPIREKLLILKGTGFIDSSIMANDFYVTPKGRVFLDLISRLYQEIQNKKLTHELEYILNKLGCQVINITQINENQDNYSQNLYVELVRTIEDSIDHWEINLKKIKYTEKSNDKICRL